MARTQQKKLDHDAVNAAIVAALDIPAEYRAMGVDVIGKEPNAAGWLSCRAVGRDDRNPSAAVNIKSGRYVDLGSEGDSVSLWDFAARHGPCADWKEARKHFADKTNTAIGRAKSKKNPNDEIAVEPWNSVLIQLWCNTKPGVTAEAVRAAGGCRAHYPARSHAHHVIGLPVFGPQLINADPVGWVVWNAGGRPLPVYDKTGQPTGTVKMKTVAGSAAGLMGFHALAQLAMEPAEQTIWKVEGPTDMLALWALIPPEKRDLHIVLCNSGGSTENVRPEIAALFAGHRVYVVHDADKPGEVGAAKWLTALGPLASEVRQVWLPYEIVETHGKDLRDWIADTKATAFGEPGHCVDIYAKLLAMAKESPIFAAGPRPVTPAGTETPAEPGAGKGADTESDGLVERRIVEALQLDVLGERDSGTIVVFASHASRRKTVEIREPDRLSYAKLLQIAGPPVQACVDESGEESYGRFSTSQVKNAICYLAGAQRISDATLVGVGCWQGRDEETENDTDSVVVVGAGEAAVWDGQKLNRVVKPRANGRLLYLSSSDPWYHYPHLAANLDRCTPAWCEGVIGKTSELWSRWRWRHQDAAPEVLTGLTLASWVQTLWHWRPQVAVLGATETGKSTLFETIGGLLNGLAVRSSKSTAAGIRQAIRTSGKIVLCDEFEKGRHRAEVLELIRAASRGDEILRGTTNQDGKRFVIRHIIWVAAIEVGLRRAPDRNRFITLELLPPAKCDQGKLSVPPVAELHELGQKLLAVAIRHIIPAKALALRLKAVSFRGIDPRVIESYAVPAAILATSCGMSEQDAGGLLGVMLETTAKEDQEASDEEDLLQAIFRAQIRVDREIYTVAQMIGSGVPERVEALSRHGLATVNERRGPRGSQEVAEYLFIDHRTVSAALLKGGEWDGQSIDTILKRIKDAAVSRRRVGGRLTYGVLVPMAFLNSEYLEDYSDPVSEEGVAGQQPDAPKQQSAW